MKLIQLWSHIIKLNGSNLNRFPTFRPGKVNEEQPIEYFCDHKPIGISNIGVD